MTETATREPINSTAATAVERAAARPTFDWLFVVALLAVIATFIRAIYFTPMDALQGPAQKIYYVHPPSAWVAFLAFGVVAVASIIYLWMKDARLDRLAECSAEVGVVFTTITLMTGSLWGKPIWGTWWTWDARLTSTLFLWFIYMGYLILRGAVEDPGMRARYSAVLGILGSLLIPFIHLSVYLFRTLHPMPIIGKPSRPSLPSDMLVTFLMSFGAFTLLYVALLRARYRLATDQAALDAEEGR
ncbi:MAG TPA: cytochrome c biogenesis protein CcsA [Gemmatimonadaceae bacterium]|nr:cytochrome c biogenesis protein CcsA [Gemmatimonadaceae bacterium]